MNWRNGRALTAPFSRSPHPRFTLSVEPRPHYHTSLCSGMCLSETSIPDIASLKVHLKEGTEYQLGRKRASSTLRVRRSLSESHIFSSKQPRPECQARRRLLHIASFHLLASTVHQIACISFQARTITALPHHKANTVPLCICAVGGYSGHSLSLSLRVFFVQLLFLKRFLIGPLRCWTAVQDGSQNTSRSSSGCARAGRGSNAPH